MPVLQTYQVVKRYGTVAANDGVDLAVEPGTIHALVGQNGAGKSTLMNILYGMVQPDSGEILLDGQRVAFASPRESLAHGLGMVHQHFMLIPPFTALENIVLGHEPHRFGLVQRQLAIRRLHKVMEQWGLEVPLDNPVGDLSVGLQQRVEILRLLYHGAQMLILDEPTAVLAPPEIDALFDILRTLRDAGNSVIFISHKLKEVLEIADQISVMRAGKIVATVEQSDANQEQITDWMIGHEGHAASPTHTSRGCPTLSQEPRLQVCSLRYRPHVGIPLEGVDLELMCGEIHSIAGVEGNGQDELLDILVGRQRPDTGKVEIDGTPVRRFSPADMRMAGMAYIPADRQREGAILDATLEENYLLGREEAFSSYGVLQPMKTASELSQKLDEYAVQNSGSAMLLRYLSGGNQQKLVIARELASEPRWIVAAHPTRGLDIQATRLVHSLLLEQRRLGVPSLLVSSDLDELLVLSDRISVMYRGKIIQTLEAEGLTDHELGRWMLGNLDAQDNTHAQT